MLDVYRTYYKLTGEPFRLGPDHRFSLHHASYANAKAYLEFAIYQGEGFIAITGGAGTGKTTLISEILAGLDREKIEVATLTSTQLESRDLLQMVASSFGLHPEKVNKADLLLEIESFLVNKLRNGHRAILIVDEAQGLSPGALEELRLLANLQYQYQLLLQIFLVGQERLLELIRAPGMEHLQQRLVAATSLDPLSFDETIDYIEHRLSRVGWKGDPAIEEPALRLVYCYSAGIPRRINLIANRLFLYGGMQEKHRFTGEDARTVIDDLIQEFLLPSEPLVDEAAVEAESAGAGEKTKARSLPRDTGGSGTTAAAAPPNPASQSGGVPSTSDEPTERREATRPSEQQERPPPANFKLDSEAMPGSRPQAKHARDARHKPRGASARRDKARRPPSAQRTSEPVRKQDRPADNPVWDDDDDDDGGSKSFLIFVLLLAGAGAGYFLYNKSIDLDRIYQLVRDTTGIELHSPQAPERADERLARTEVLPAPPEIEPGGAAQDLAVVTDSGVEIQVGDKGQIIREQQNTLGEESVATDAVPGTHTAGTSEQTEPAREPPPETVVETPVAERTEQALQAAAPAAPAPVSSRQVVTPALATPVVKESTAVVARVPVEPVAPVAPQAAEDEPAAPALPPPVAVVAQQPQVKPSPAEAAAPKPAAKSVAPVTVASAAGSAISGSASPPIDTQRARLRQAAEKRFSEQVARLNSDLAAPPVTPAAATTPSVPSPDLTTSRAEPPSAEPAPKKKPSITPAEIKATLLEGRWSSSGKPASLLPSESTYCDNRGDRIWCVSVPQNVKTQYGLALYKVETTLTEFSAEGHFEMSYRTLVKLVGAETSGGQQGPDTAASDGWQITSYSMSCTLIDADQVSCLDGKGITRRYLRIGRGKS